MFLVPHLKLIVFSSGALIMDLTSKMLPTSEITFVNCQVALLVGHIKRLATDGESVTFKVSTTRV